MMVRRSGFAAGTIIDETGSPSLARLPGDREIDKQGGLQWRVSSG